MDHGNGFLDQPRDDELTETLLGYLDCGWSDYREIVEATDAELDRVRDLLSL